MKNPNYEIQRGANGCQLCNFRFEWIDITGERQTVDTDDLESAQITIGLLSGEICLADLEPQNKRDENT